MTGVPSVNSDKIRITKKYGGVADNVIEYTLSSGIWTPPSGKALTLQAGATYQAVSSDKLHQHSIFTKRCDQLFKKQFAANGDITGKQRNH